MLRKGKLGEEEKLHGLAFLWTEKPPKNVFFSEGFEIRRSTLGDG